MFTRPDTCILERQEQWRKLRLNKSELTPKMFSFSVFRYNNREKHRNSNTIRSQPEERNMHNLEERQKVIPCLAVAVDICS